MKQALKRILLRLVTAAGLPQALLPRLVDSTRDTLRQEWKRESDRLAGQLDKALDRQARQADKALTAGLRDLQERVKAQDARLRVLERQAEGDRRRLSRLEELLADDEPADPEALASLDLQRIAGQVKRRLEATPISTEPFAHMIVEQLLPADFYGQLVAAIPPEVFFAREKKSKHDFRPSTGLAPQRTREIWGYMDRQVCPQVLKPLLLERFAPLLDAHLLSQFGEAALEQARGLPMTTFDGRVMRRRPGYRLAPHQDPRRFFLTALLYLPTSSDDDPRWGTQLFAADRALSNPVKNIYYPEDQGVRCSLVKTAPYRPNSLLVFLNDRSLHGAEIPPQDAPADLERYSFQFYIGPETAALQSLVDSLPDERRSAWRTTRAAIPLAPTG